MSLFSDIVDSIKAWVKENIEGWVEKWGTVIRNTFTTVYETIQNVYNNVTEFVTNKYYETKQYITNVYNETKQYITNNVQNITKYITNKYYETRQYVTNVIGVSQEWVDNRVAAVRNYVDESVAGVDTVGFFKDPMGYIETAFNRFIEAWVHGVAKSFAEGLKEGAQGSNPGPVGPGRSLLLGFEEGMKEMEEREEHG